jgi:hypothetical protein
LEQEAGTQSGWNLIDDIRASVHGFEPHTKAEEQLYSEGLDQVARLGDARRTRLIASEEGVPAVLWSVLIFGGSGCGWLHVPVRAGEHVGSQADGGDPCCDYRAGFVHHRRPWAPVFRRGAHRDGVFRAGT